MAHVYIYGLKDPQTNQFKYVGRTTRSLVIRLIEHIILSSAPNCLHTPKDHWIANLQRQKLSPIIELLDEFDEDFAHRRHQIEQYWISKLSKSDDLFNTPCGRRKSYTRKPEEGGPLLKISQRKGSLQFPENLV